MLHYGRGLGQIRAGLAEIKEEEHAPKADSERLSCLSDREHALQNNQIDSILADRRQVKTPIFTQVVKW